MADTPTMQQADGLVGRVIGGKYRVERVVGQGGCGLVVRAVHRGLGHPFALKLLKPGLATRDDVARRFVREAQALATLTSEHTVRAFDVGVEPDLGPYFVMEWLDGLTLAQALATGPVDVPTAVDYALQTCAALAEAHRAGVIHRDIKPSNLFVTRRTDGRALVKVTDFGIAKSTGPGGAITAPDVVLGSPGYLAPEQARDARSVDARADIWAVGAVLHELLSGRPLRGDAINAAGHPAPLRLWVPPSLRATIDRCLAPDRDARYPHVAALAADLAIFAPPRAAALAPAIARIAHAPSSPRTAGRDRPGVARAPTLDLIRPRPAAPPPPRRRAPRRRTARLHLAFLVSTAALVALVAALVIRARPSPAGRLPARAPSPPPPAPLPLVTPLPQPAPPVVDRALPLVNRAPPLADRAPLAPPAPPAPAPLPRPRPRPTARPAPLPAPPAAAPPPRVPGDIDGDGIPDVR